MFTTARGRDAVFWQTARVRKQARPQVRVPTARAAGIADLEVVVDTREQYPYRFAGQQVRTARRALPCRDYAVLHDGRLVAAVERKSPSDLVTSLTTGKLRFDMTELAALPRAAVVVEDRFSQLFTLTRIRPARHPRPGPQPFAPRDPPRLAHRPHARTAYGGAIRAFGPAHVWPSS